MPRNSLDEAPRLQNDRSRTSELSEVEARSSERNAQPSTGIFTRVLNKAATLASLSSRNSKQTAESKDVRESTSSAAPVEASVEEEVPEAQNESSSAKIGKAKTAQFTNETPEYYSNRLTQASSALAGEHKEGKIQRRAVRIEASHHEGHHLGAGNLARRKLCYAYMFRFLSWFAQWWSRRFRTVALCSSLYELWSMGIWLGFLTEPDVSMALRWLLLFDAVANGIVVVDTVERLVRWWVEMNQRVAREHEMDLKAKKERVSKDKTAKMKAAALANHLAARKELWTIVPKLVLALAMFPAQVIIDKMLTTDSITANLVPVILVFRMSRVGWATMDSIQFINRKEMDVYVDIRIQGSVGGSGSSWQVILKQFLIVLFWGHWVGCATYGLRALVKSQVWQKNIGATRGIPRTETGARDYFQKFASMGKLVGYEVGKDFGASYAVALYKGVGWNFEDIVPERPEELVLELLTVAFITAIRSYCVGSFFKFHSMREMETQQFTELMESVHAYMESCELPPSLRKAVVQHFNFQQGKRREVQTLEVLRNLPLEVQMHLREHEYVPIAIGKNPRLFQECSYDFCLQVCLLLDSLFLQPGETIFLEGDSCRELSFLSEGSVALSRYAHVGAGKATETLICYIRSERKEDPSVLGEAAFLLEKNHLYSARVRAGADAIVMHLSRETFDSNLAGPFPEQYDFLLRNMAVTFSLGTEGEDIALLGKDKADQESEHFQSMREEVRGHLMQRKEALNDKFTYCASTGDAENIAIILAQRVDPNTSDYDKRSAVHLAASEGAVETLEAILKAGGDANLRDRWSSTPLQDALSNGFVAAAKLIQKYGGDLGLDDPSGLLCACASEGNTPKMQQLLEFKVDLNAGDYDNRTSLHLAATEGRLTVVAFLVASLANVNVKDRWNSTPLEDAIRNGFDTVANHLRTHGGRVDGEFAANLLCDAACTGNLAQLKMLVENGVDAGVGDFDMRTAMHLAAAEGQLLALHFLINVANANHSPLDRWQKTPLQDALAGSHHTCVNLLLAKGGSLGPSASHDEERKVQQIMDMWFANDCSEFYAGINALRQQIASHSSLVSQGRARSDIFERDVALRFSRLLLNQQIGMLHTFSKNARILVDLLQRLEELAVKPLGQMLRILIDGASLAAEGKFWLDYNALNSKRARTHKDKDVALRVFDNVMISSMSIVPRICEIIDSTSKHLIKRIDRFQEKKAAQAQEGPPVTAEGTDPAGRRESKMETRSNFGGSRSLSDFMRPRAKSKLGLSQPQARGGIRNSSMNVDDAVSRSQSFVSSCNFDVDQLPSMSELVVEELFRTLGWADVEDKGTSGREAYTMAFQFFGNDSAKYQMKVIQRLNKVVTGLLPFAHLKFCFQQNIFREWKFEAQTMDLDGIGYDWHPTSATSRPNEALAKCLNECSYSFSLGRKPKAELSADLRPTVQWLHTLQPILHEFRSPSLANGTSNQGSEGRPKRSFLRRSNTCRLKEDFADAEMQIDLVLKPPSAFEGRAKRQASRQLVATELVLTALAALILHESSTTEVQQGKGGGLPEHAQKDGGKMKMIRDLGKIFGTALSHCEGEKTLTESYKKQLLESARIAARDAKKDIKKAKKDKKAGKEVRDKDNVPNGEAAQEDAQEADEEEEITLETSGNNSRIQMAKILGNKGDLDPEELGVLLDFSDDFSRDGDGHVSVFGPISQIRFTINLLRWLLNHEGRQKEMFAEIMQNRCDTERTLCYLSSTDLQTSPIVMKQLDRMNNDDISTDLESVVERLSCGVEVALSADDLELFDDAEVDEEQMSVIHSSEGTQDDKASGEPRATIRYTKMTVNTERTANSNFQDWMSDHPPSSVPARLEAARSRCPNCCQSCAAVLDHIHGRVRACFTGGRNKAVQKKQIFRKFRELDEDGEGIGVLEVSQILGDWFRHTLGQEQELRAAHRMFEILEKDEIGELVTFAEFWEALPQLENEVREQQRKNARRNNANTTGASMMRVFAWMVISPDASWLVVWDTIKKTAVMYYMLEVPVNFCFVAIDKMAKWQSIVRTSLSIFFDIFMAINTVLNFFRSFLHPTRGFITHFQEIRMNYLVEFFFIDALACLPLDWLIPDTSGVASGNRGFFSRPRALAKLNRLLHLRHLVFRDNRASRSASEQRLRMASAGFGRTAWELLKFAAAMVHFLGCIWWYLGSRWDAFSPQLGYLSNATRSSWIYGYDVVKGEPPLGDEEGETPFWWQYLISFFWSSGRIAQVGTYGSLYPGSAEEMIWCCVMFLVSFAVSGYVDGILAGKVMTSDEGVIQALATKRIVDDYLQTVDLADELAEKIRSTASATVALQLSRSTEDVSRQLPHLMKQKIARRAFLPYFEKSGIFKNCTHNFMVEIGTACKIIVATKGSLLVSVGEPAERMLILFRGRLAFLDRGGRTFLESGRPGEIVGDIELVFDIKHEIGARAVEETKLISLDRASFYSICQRFPGDRIALQRSVIDAVEGFTGGGGSDVMSGSGQDASENSKDKDKDKADAKSATTTSSGSTEGSLSVQALRHRVFLAELQRASEKTQAEQNDAKQSIICRYIDAAATGSLKVVQTVLGRHDVEVDEADYDQRTALHLAVCEGHVNVVRFLVEDYNASLAVTDRFGNMPLDDAVREKRMEVAQYLVERSAGFKVDVDMAGLLCQAAFDADMDTLKLLFQIVGASPNDADYDGRTALHLGASEGHKQVVELLAGLPEININPKDRFGNTPLDDAIRHQHRQVRKILQEKGGEMGEQQLGVSLCGLGAANDVSRLKELAESGVPMSQGNYDARTSLHLAASEGNVEAVAFLLKSANVPPNPLDRFLSTPLDDAIRHGRQSIESLLREHGGLSGSASDMVEEVQRFRKFKEAEKEKKGLAKLERETKATEIHHLATGLARYAEHASFSDDIHTYVNHAATFRKVLFQLLRHEAFKNCEEAMACEDGTDFDKERFERVMDLTLKGLDATGARLEVLVESDMIPWVTGLSKSQARLAKLFMPGLAQTLRKIRDHFKSRVELAQAVKKLWTEGSKSYQCTPLGILVHKLQDSSSYMVQKSRLDALAMLWLTSDVGAVEDEGDASKGDASKQQTSVDQTDKQSFCETERDDHQPFTGSAALRLLASSSQ